MARFGGHSFSRQIFLICISFSLALFIIVLSRYRSTLSLNDISSLESKPIDVSSSRSPQVFYLDKNGYKVLLNSDFTVNFIEDKNLRDVEREDLEVESPTSSVDSWSYSMADTPMSSYEVKNEENEAERDETIDYNFALTDVASDVRHTLPKRPRCSYNQPTKNIIQMKTHRTGSSTLANILYRYGDLNQLDFALPKESSYEYYWPVRFSPSFVDKQYVNSSKPHMLVNAQFDTNSMRSFMGKEAFVITILRDPISHFESSFYTNGLDYLFGLENSSNPLQEFLSEPQKYMTEYLQKEKKIDIRLNHAVNGQIFDLGLKRIHFSDQEVINNTIEELNEAIDLVFIVEYLDESLVLLKRALCWDLDDVVYFTHRERAKDYKDLNITGNMKEQTTQWNSADISLYNYFNNSLWRKIKAQDNVFFDEVQELRSRRLKLERECIESTTVDAQTGEIRFKIVQESPTIHKYLCDKMNMAEKDYIAYLKEKTRIRFQEAERFINKRFQEVENLSLGNSTIL